MKADLLVLSVFVSGIRARSGLLQVCSAGSTGCEPWSFYLSGFCSSSRLSSHERVSSSDLPSSISFASSLLKMKDWQLYNRLGATLAK